jgi:hypothetical protein
MIRSNSKKAIENIRKYIIDYSDFSGYTLKEFYFANLEDLKKGAGLEIFPEIAKGIYNIFEGEYLNNDYRFRRGTHSIQKLFSDYCAGLPSALDTCYYYNSDPIDIISNILEMTPEEEKERDLYIDNINDFLKSKNINFKFDDLTEQDYYNILKENNVNFEIIEND